VLRAAARDVVSIGLNRRRGFGWATVFDAEPPPISSLIV